MKRQTVAIIFGSKPDFNEEAFKYFVLQLNKLQSSFEFEFPFQENYPLTGDEVSNQTAFDTFKNITQTGLLKLEKSPDFLLGIVNFPIDYNQFCSHDEHENIAVITTAEWNKYFSPPSVFEYLLGMIMSELVFMHPKLNPHLESHDETRGCMFDYAENKHDVRVDVGLGYICDQCKAIIRNDCEPGFLEEITKIVSREWMGNLNSPGTMAYDLKRYYKFDIDRDSGFNKSFWEKVKDHFAELPKEIIVAVISVLIGAWIGAYFATK